MRWWGKGSDARAAIRAAWACVEERRFVDAITPAETALRDAPELSEPWQILVVAYKHAARWRDVIEATDRILGIDGELDEGQWWNRAIAATALEEWTQARAAWAAAGVELGAGAGPVEMSPMLVPIRVALATEPEVVWCERIDPCRARIRSIPFPECDRGYDDVVVHDGEPRGERRIGDRTLAVLDELAVLARSAYGTWLARVDANDVAEIGDLFADGEVVAEDWTSSTRTLCESCSLGVPHEHHGESPVDEPIHRFAFAARDEGELAPLRARFGVVPVRLR